MPNTSFNETTNEIFEYTAVQGQKREREPLKTPKIVRILYKTIVFQYN